jgi:hypothetical protein
VILEHSSNTRQRRLLPIANGIDTCKDVTKEVKNRYMGSKSERVWKRAMLKQPDGSIAKIDMVGRTMFASKATTLIHTVYLRK